MIGWHAFSKVNLLPLLYVNSWAHFAAHFYPWNVTRFRLLFVCHVQRWELFYKWMRLHELWWKALPFTFAVSTLASRSDSPNAERFTFPLGLAEPKKHKTRVWATDFFSVLGGKRGLVLWEIIEVTFLWMSELKAETIHCLFTLLTAFSRLKLLYNYELYKYGVLHLWVSTAIGLWKHRIPSDLRS